MGLTIAPEAVPLCADESGAVRVAQTRVTLDTVVEMYDDGCSAEEIASRLPVLRLSDVYATIAYYLSHRGEVLAYLREGAQQAEHWREVWEKRCSCDGIRARLLRRQAGKTSAP